MAERIGQVPGRWWFGAASLVALATLLAAAAGCSGSGGRDVRGGERVAVLAAPHPGDIKRAAAAAARPTTSEWAMTMTVAIPGDGTTTTTMRAQVDEARHRTKLDVTSGLPDSGSGNEPGHRQEIITIGETMYVHAANASWTRIDVDPAIGKAIRKQYDPTKGTLGMLEQMSGDLHPDGKATIGGVPTNRWSGPLDPSRLAKFGQALGFPQLGASELADFRNRASGTVAAYLDGDLRLRRMTMDMDIQVAPGESIHTSEDERAVSLGRPLAVNPPPANLVLKTQHAATSAELLKILQHELGG